MSPERYLCVREMYDAANAIAGALFLTSARVLLTTCICGPLESRKRVDGLGDLCAGSGSPARTARTSLSLCILDGWTIGLHLATYLVLELAYISHVTGLEIMLTGWT